jgi:hypothetical protein
VIVPFALLTRLDDPVAAYPLLLLLTGMATAAWLWGWRRAAYSDPRPREGGTASEEGAAGTYPSRAWIPVLGVSLLLRVLALSPQTPLSPLSDDLYRYLWDGRVGNAGIHPFRHAPTSDELAFLRDGEVWPRINHPDIPTIYPPTAQLFFRLVDGISPSALGMRAALAIVDTLGVALLALLLRRCGRSPALALVHGWCPLAVLESSAGGHVDALGVTILIAGLLALRGTRAGPAVLGGLGLGLSGMVKPIAPFLAPVFLARGSGPRRIAVAGGGLAALLLVLPYAGVGERLFTGFQAYAAHWRFNDAVFSPLIAVGASYRAARLILAGMLVAVVIVTAWRSRDALAASGTIVLALLFLSPTVHPWYGIWLVPLLAFLPPALRPAGVALVALLPVSYAAAWLEGPSGVWEEPLWSRITVWGPVLLLAARGGLQANRARAPRGKSSRGS